MTQARLITRELDLLAGKQEWQSVSRHTINSNLLKIETVLRTSGSSTGTIVTTILNSFLQ